MNELVGLAFGAGLIAPVNPCGFGLLPAVVTAVAGPTRSEGTARGLAARLAGGLRAGLALTIGFTSTLTVVGLAITAGVRSLITLVPRLSAALGAVLVLVGLAIAGGRHPSLRLPGPRPGTTTPGTGRMVAFGAGYVIASVSCALAVLLAVVAQAAAGTPADVATVFTAYL